MDKIEEELVTLLNNYERQLKEKREKEEKVRRKEDIFLKRFRRLRTEVIKPVIDKISSKLKERGHDYSLEESEERKDADGRMQDAYITIIISFRSMCSGISCI